MNSEMRPWTRWLTLPLASLPEPPVRVEALVGKGFHLLLHTADGQCLHLIFSPPGQDREGYLATDATCLQYTGEQIPDDARGDWLRAIAQRVSGAECRTGWDAFLVWAWKRPPVALPGGDDQGTRLTSGSEVLMRIAPTCNAHCAFCCFKGVMPDLVGSLEGVRERLEWASQAGVKNACFTGGEPTLLPDLEDYLREARKAVPGLLSIQTNGLLLARPGVVERLAAAGLDTILLSVHSPNAEVHDAMLGVPGAHDRALEGARKCLDQNIAVAINCVINRTNLGSAEGMPGLVASELGGEKAHLVYSLMSPQGTALDHPELMVPLDEVGPVLAQGIDRGQALGVRVVIPGLCGVPMCVLPGYEEHFDESQDPNPPPELPTRTFTPACDGCQWRSRCSGFWQAHLDRFGPEEIGPRSAVGKRPG